MNLTNHLETQRGNHPARLNRFLPRLAFGLLAMVVLAVPTSAISRDPNGVNVNSQGATTVFITFGGLNDLYPWRPSGAAS